MATKTFCDICDDMINPSMRRYRVVVGETEYNEVCPFCHRSITEHVSAMKDRPQQEAK